MKTYHAFFALSVLIAAVGCGNNSTSTKGDLPPLTAGDTSNAPAPVGLKALGKEDVKVGTGKEVAPGDLVNVTYIGKLTSFDGKVFDASSKHDDNPLAFPVGAGFVVKGFDEGVVGMKKGGVRRISIPAVMGYGAQAKEDIPANSDLFFEVTLLDVIKKGDEDFVDSKDVKVGGGAAVKNGSKVTFHYDGKLPTGKSFEHQDKLTHVIGKGDILPALEAGMVGMKEGGVRDLRLGPDLYKGSIGSGDTYTSNYILTFEITVDKVE